MHNPYDFTTPPGPRLQRLRDHIKQLAREHTVQQIQALHTELADLPPEQAATTSVKITLGRSCRCIIVYFHPDQYQKTWTATTL